MPFATLIKPLAINELEVVLRLLFALLLGGVIGLEREYKNRPAGMRTHLLVCLGAASISMLESLMWSTSITGGVSLSLGRLSAQVISGIGFLGAGTIFMAQKKISGLTTAASLWNVACLGILVGFGFYWIASILCFLVVFVLQLLGRIVKINAVKHVEIRYVNRQSTLPFINAYFQSVGIQVLDVDFHIESPRDPRHHADSLYTNIYTLHLPYSIDYIDIVTHLSEYQDIQVVRTRNV